MQLYCIILFFFSTTNNTTLLLDEAQASTSVATRLKAEYTLLYVYKLTT